MKLLLLSGLGLLGVWLRWGLVTWGAGATWPWPVLAVNVIGSFLAGWIYVFGQTSSTGQTWSALILVGFLGALTTYSSYALDTMRLLMAAQWGMAALNVLSNNILSLGACYLGMKMYEITHPV